MHFGLNAFVTDYSMPAADLGRAAEERGFESLFIAEHTHIPASRQSPWPGGAELPQQYWHGLDPFVACTAAATATQRLKIGTGVCLVIERDTITLAKEVASVDHISGGRFLFGIGGGWNREEMENHGTNPKTRFRKLREQILAMKEIWTKESAEYHGEFVNFDPIWSHPKPVQKPHIPILIGGAGDKTLDRVIEYGDGWMPIGGRGGVSNEKLAELREKAAAAGRSDISVTIFGMRPDRAEIERYEKAGVVRVTFGLPDAATDEMLPLLDTLAKFVAEYGSGT